MYYSSRTFLHINIPSSQPDKFFEENSHVSFLVILSVAPVAFYKGIGFNKQNWNGPISIFLF